MKGKIWCTALRVTLVSVNVFVLLLCLAVFVTGLWARLSENSYLTVTGELNITRTSLAMVVAGFCAALMALGGILGGVLLQSLLGRIVLSVYAFVLLFLIVAEVAAGVAAIQYRDNLENGVQNSSIQPPHLRGIQNSTVESLKAAYSDALNTSTPRWNSWDQFQQEHKCCGALDYTDFFTYVFDEEAVPQACCTGAAKSRGQCDQYLKYLDTPDDVGDIHTEPCLNIIVPRLRATMLVLAIVAITIGACQVSGAVFSIVALFITVRAEERSHHLYKKLHKRTRGSSEYYSRSESRSRST